MDLSILKQNQDGYIFRLPIRIVQKIIDMIEPIDQVNYRMTCWYNYIKVRSNKSKVLYEGKVKWLVDNCKYTDNNHDGHISYNSKYDFLILEQYGHCDYCGKYYYEYSGYHYNYCCYCPYCEELCCNECYILDNDLCKQCYKPDHYYCRGCDDLIHIDSYNLNKNLCKYCSNQD
jgi:hypothetical protein